MGQFEPPLPVIFPKIPKIDFFHKKDKALTVFDF